MSTIAGRARCRLHGGLTLKASDSPRFKHGFYSKHLPPALRADFKRLLDDPDLLDGRAEVSLLQVRLTQLTARLGTNESKQTWRELAGLFDRFRVANAAGDMPAQLEVLNRLNEIITGQVNDDAAWDEATDFIEKVTRVAEREWKRVIANRTVATTEQVRGLVATMTEAVLLYVTDTQARQQICDHINRLRIVQHVSPADVEVSGAD